MKISKKLVFFVIVILFSLFLILGSEVIAQEVLRVTTWGGQYNKSYDETIGIFEKENNCKVEWVIGDCPSFNIKARLNQVDVVTTDLGHSIAGENEGLWAELDPTKIPNMAHLYDIAKYSQYTVFANVGDFVLAYNSKYIKTTPTSWNELWDPAYKNRVALYQFLGSPTLGLMLQQAEQAGGGIDNIDPGLDRMYELYKSGNIITFAGGDSEIQSLLETEEAWLAQSTNGRVVNSWEKGLDFIKLARPKEGTVGMITTLNVVKGTKKLDLAMKFINYALSPECQLVFAQNSYYSPTVDNVKIPTELESILLSQEEIGRLFIPDWSKINKVKDEWAERWDKMISQ